MRWQILRASCISTRLGELQRYSIHFVLWVMVICSELQRRSYEADIYARIAVLSPGRVVIMKKGAQDIFALQLIRNGIEGI